MKTAHRLLSVASALALASSAQAVTITWTVLWRGAFPGVEFDLEDDEYLRGNSGSFEADVAPDKTLSNIHNFRGSNGWEILGFEVNPNALNAIDNQILLSYVEVNRPAYEAGEHSSLFAFSFSPYYASETRCCGDDYAVGPVDSYSFTVPESAPSATLLAGLLIIGFAAKRGLLRS